MLEYSSNINNQRYMFHRFLPFSWESNALWKMMERDGAPKNTIRLINAFYQRTSARVYVYWEFTKFFEKRISIRQGTFSSNNIQLRIKVDNGRTDVGTQVCKSVTASYNRPWMQLMMQFFRLIIVMKCK